MVSGPARGRVEARRVEARSVGKRVAVWGRGVWACGGTACGQAFGQACLQATTQNHTARALGRRAIQAFIPMVVGALAGEQCALHGGRDRRHL